MVRYYLVIILLFSKTLLVGQRKTTPYNWPQDRPLTKKEQLMNERNHGCIKRKTETLTARLKNYPFSMSTQIQIVSFEGNRDSKGKFTYKNDSLPRQNDTICYSKLKEVKTLNFLQIDSLTDILYNYLYKGEINPYVISHGTSYPRNAILFLDNTGKAFEYIVICFECGMMAGSSKDMWIGYNCDQKMNMLKELFRKFGLVYGITKGLIGDD